MRISGFLLPRDGRVRLRGVRTAKVALAATVAYAVAQPLSSNARPILAPLTALLVVQLTLYETLRTGLRRVVSVVAGVLVAVGFSSLLHLNALSLGFVVAASLVIGRLLRLGSELLEVPISAMLVLAVGGAQSAATGRVAETVIGAVVGVAVGAAVAPPLYVRPAGEAVQNLAQEMSDVLRRMADELTTAYTREQASAWLDAARGLGADILRADRALTKADDSLRLNLRALRTPHAGVSLHSGLESLEHAAVALRAVSRSLLDRALGGSPEQVYGEDVRLTLSELLRQVAGAVEVYGQLIGAEVAGAGPHEPELQAAQDAAWVARDRLTELLRTDARVHVHAWQLHGDLLANIDRMLREIDVEERTRLRESWDQPRDRRGPAEAVLDGLKGRNFTVVPRRRRRRPPRRRH